MTAYEKICAEVCEWCAKGCGFACVIGKIDARRVHEKVSVLGTHSFPICTASSRDEVIERLTADVGQIQEKLSAAKAVIQQARDDFDTIAYAHSIRSDLQSTATLRENWQHTFDAAWNSRARLENALNGEMW